MRAYRVAYDGTDYAGFQRQPNVDTIEDAIFDALRALEVLEPGERKPPSYAAAGRTDAGVSAVAQTVAFEAPNWLTPRALNSRLPANVRAWASTEVPKDFHATHHATRRVYTYHLYAPRDGGFVPGTEPEQHTESDHEPFDDGRFRVALETLSGPHDFANLTPDDDGTERAPTLEATRDGPFLVVTVSSGGFARELVRQLIAVARDVAIGVLSYEGLERALDPEPLPGHEGIAPAPPEPLVLSAVEYGDHDLDFILDERAATDARATLERRRIERLVGARVAGDIRDGIGE
ncbi:tRNA pseudouridine(38-40) synthase TruA [Halobacteria archaeon AArc-curdl1]|uniref:tRNA pseudouridine synthase A n=1 Tax=Natronosalvus hydrolyticus TaxID=2979988 RepID=A0AAP2Z6T5_9EURY|nr:tRNA pseudouridine(38-40) synthase TruA [Halobacteria archaeon AArc-curdl1]